MKKFLSIALCLMLCLSLCATAFAVDNTPAYTDLANTGLVKQLSMVDEITDPGFTFTFVFSPVTASAAPYFTPASGPSPTLVSTSMTDAEDLKSGSVTFASLFGTAENLAGFGITHAGVWQFTVAEKNVDATYSGTSVSTTETEKTTITKKMTSSTASYVVTLIVKNGQDGKPAVEGVIVETSDGAKVDPTITTQTIGGSDGTSGSSGSTAVTSGFQFDNKYTETKKVEPIDPNNPDPTVAALSVKKLVTGDFGDRTLAFEFTVALTAPSSLAADLNGQSFAGTVTRDTTQPTTETANSVSLTFGADGKASATVKLSDKDVLSIPELPVGVSYTVSETAVTGYTASATGTNSGEIKTAGGSMKAEVTNDFQYTPPTGVVINNLPFILIVALAIGGIAVYFVSNRRREQED